MALNVGKDSRGALVVIEGLDRAGKTSQCQLLCDSLKAGQIPVRYVKFPDRTTPTGQMINSYLTGQAQQDDHSIHLLFSANRWEAVGQIKSDIEKGMTVVIDRYSYSGAVYSAAKDNPNLSLEWAWAPEIGLPKPDVTIFLNITPQEAAKRGGYGEERYETSKMQMRVRALFKHLFDKLGGDNVQIIEAGRPVEVVASDISRAVLASIKGVSSGGQLEQLGPLEP